MDVEELRRSQRRHRKARPERPTDIPLMSVSGSQDSDDDDEVTNHWPDDFFTSVLPSYTLEEQDNRYRLVNIESGRLNEYCHAHHFSKASDKLLHQTL